MLLPFFQENGLEAGCDEAGRGCLAGPVVAASVILPREFDHPRLNDSKLLQPHVREILRDEIEAYALSFAVAFVDHQTIDKINILNATFLAMNQAIRDLCIRPDRLLIDGNRFSNQTGIPYVCLVKGDSHYRSIAAASILAKTQRDAFMNKIHEEYPQYNWGKNKGYATREHLLAIARHGLSPYHRVSFRSTLQWRLFE